MSSNLHLESSNSVQKYLERIKYNGPLDGTAEALAALQWAHVHTVPYENLDILRGKYISLDIPDVYEKVIIRKRGGYCFELNGLFAWLLKKLSYKVTEFYGRFLDGEPLEIPMRRHRISRVDVEGKAYICDVGVGASAPRKPLLLAEGLEQKQGDEAYRIVRDPVLGWVVQFLRNNEWNRLYSFTEDPQYPIDFEMPNHWCLTHPDSIFRNNTMVYIRTPQGRKTIADVVNADGKKVKEFREYTPNGVKRFVLETEKDFREVLLNHFGIVLD